MCIIIYYSDSVHLSLVLEASVGTFEIGQSLPDNLRIDAKQFGGGDSGGGIVNIIQPRYAQGIGTGLSVRSL